MENLGMSSQDLRKPSDVETLRSANHAVWELTSLSSVSCGDRLTSTSPQPQLPSDDNDLLLPLTSSLTPYLAEECTFLPRDTNTLGRITKDGSWSREPESAEALVASQMISSSEAWMV